MNRLSFGITIVLMILILSGIFTICFAIVSWFDLPNWSSSAMTYTSLYFVFGFGAYFGPTRFETIFSSLQELSTKDKFIFLSGIIINGIAPFFEGYFFKDLSQISVILLLTGNVIIVLIGIWATGSPDLRKALKRNSKSKKQSPEVS